MGPERGCCRCVYMWVPRGAVSSARGRGLREGPWAPRGVVVGVCVLYLRMCVCLRYVENEGIETNCLNAVYSLKQPRFPRCLPLCLRQRMGMCLGKSLTILQCHEWRGQELLSTPSGTSAWCAWTTTLRWPSYRNRAATAVCA